MFLSLAIRKRGAIASDLASLDCFTESRFRPKHKKSCGNGGGFRLNSLRS